MPKATYIEHTEKTFQFRGILDPRESYLHVFLHDFQLCYYTS